MTKYKNSKNDPQLNKKLEELEKEISEYETELDDVKKKVEKMGNELDADMEEYIKVDLENEYIKYKEKKKSKGIVRRYGPLMVGIPSIVCGVLEMEEDPNTGMFELGVGFITSGWGIYQKTKEISHKLAKKINNYFNKPPFSPRNIFREKAKKYRPLFSDNILIVGNSKYH